LKSRLYLLDAIRGFSVISMILYHFAFDLYDFNIYPVGIGTPPLEAWRLSIVTVFVAVSGISANLSRSRIKRALITIGAAYLVTIATYFFNPNCYVVFGVLHCLGFSALIYALLKKFIDRVPRKIAPILWLGLFIALSFVEFPTTAIPHLYAFGITDYMFVSSDYYPLIPYLFLFFFGTSVSGYIKERRLPERLYAVRARPLEFIGRHALLIYIIHQPILIGIIMLIFSHIRI